MNETSLLYISFRIARLSILLGMAAYGTSTERVRAKKYLKEELNAAYPPLDSDQIHSTAIWLGLDEGVVLPLEQFPLEQYFHEEMNEGIEWMKRMESPAFRHPFQSPMEILTELFVYGQAALMANPLLRKRCRMAANYYIDHSGTNPYLFMKARDTFNIERHDIDRWFSHKGWVLQLRSPSPNEGRRKNALQKL